MHSSFKAKHNFNKQHSFNPYSRSLPTRPSSVQRSVNHKTQEFETPTSHPQFGQRSLLPPLVNGYNKVTHVKQTVDHLPLKLVFSKAVNMSTRKMEYNVGPDMYFRRESPTRTEIPKKRLPLADLLYQNSVEPSFSSDKFETFRSISSHHKSIKEELNDKENDVEEIEVFEELQFTPPKMEIPHNVQQQKAKQMFDFGSEPQREVRCRSNHNSDRQQQPMPHKLMTSADFLGFPSTTYRCSSPVTSSSSSPRLPVFDNEDENDSFLGNSNLNLSPNLAASTASGSSYNKALTALELFSFNETTPNLMSATPLPCKSPDFHMLSDNNSSLNEEFGGSECSFNMSGRNCNDSGSHFDNRLQNSIGGRCNQEGSGNYVNSTQNYDGSRQSFVGGRSNHEGSGNSNGRGQSIVGRTCNHEGSGNSVNSTRNYDGKRQHFVGGRYNRGCNSVNCTQNDDGIGQNYVDRRYNNQEGNGRSSVKSTRNCDGIAQNYVDRFNNHLEGSGRNSVNSMQNYDAIGLNHVDGRFNQEGFGYESLGGLSNNYYNVGECGDNLSSGNCNDNDSERYSVSSETVIPKHLTDLWLSESSLSSSSNFYGPQNNDVSTAIVIDDDDDEIEVAAATGNTSKPEIVFHGQLDKDEVGRLVNCANRTSRKVCIREPMLSYPDEE